MPKIILSGCNGRMGRAITDICAAKPDMQIVAGFDLNACGFSVRLPGLCPSGRVYR